MRSYYSKDKKKFGDMSYESKYLLDPKYMTKRDLQHYYRYYNSTKNRSQFKKIVVIICLICFFCYLFVDYNLKTKIIQLKNRFDIIDRMEADYNVTQAYFVDTTGCRMPYFEVTDDNIVQFMNKPKAIECNKPLTITPDEGEYIIVNMNDTELLEYYNITDARTAKCQLSELRRKTDGQNEYLNEIAFTLQYKKIIPIKSNIEFIRVDCRDSLGKMFYREFHFFGIAKGLNELKTIKETLNPSAVSKLPKKFKNFKNYERVSFNKSLPKLIEMKSSKNKNKIHNNKKNKKTERLSVMILGIDSVSHLNFLRQMRRTADFIHHKLNHVEFWGYNKVGDNTYPNLVPLFSGLDETELNISCLSPVKHTSFDKCSFIWKRYKDAGFKTVFAEDVAELSLFNFLKPGFKKQPTDYYLRPIMLDMERFTSYENDNNVHLCMAGRRTADVLFEYIRKLLPLMRKENFFSFFWSVTLTHESFNMPVLLDENFVELFQLFEKQGIFDKTVIFLMSDHGLRWGSFRYTYQGMMEERQPLLMAIYPKWLKKAYPLAINNMELNAKRLTTHYDLHATLMDLINLRNLDAKRLNIRTEDLNDNDNVMPRGLSLFLPIPETRTCENAGIASHWCTCHQRQEMPTNDNKVQKAARYLVKLINEKLKTHPQCRTLYLNSIIRAYIAAPHHKIVQEVTNDYSIDITLRIQTKPGLALFESTVRMSSYGTNLTGTISRINLYSSQSYCVDDYAMKMFCYCHR